ncbi:hypothetical protein EDB83DRAFT_1347981 [Lactarius deliciosus]|nr:hypothetical protein EDB83DRAFT_1347981 [Lactarius deliciosus]
MDVARNTADIVFLAPDLERALGVLLLLSRGAVRSGSRRSTRASERWCRSCSSRGACGSPNVKGCLGEYPARAYPHVAVFSFALSRGAGSWVGVRDLSLERRRGISRHTELRNGSIYRITASCCPHLGLALRNSQLTHSLSNHYNYHSLTSSSLF